MIEIKNLTKSYVRSSNRQRVLALDSINLTIRPGEMVSLVGPSGAGKSTLVKLLIGEGKPDSGEIIIAGRDIAKLASRELPYYRRKIGVVFQDFRLLPHKTVWENVAFALEVADVSDKEIKDWVPKLLTLVGLADRADNYPSELSGGEEQRAAIARAMIHSPKILIADEPTGNLDPVTTQEITDLLEKINRNGTVVILATHNQLVVDRLRRRVIVLDHGKIVADAESSKYIVPERLQSVHQEAA